MPELQANSALRPHGVRPVVTRCRNDIDITERVQLAKVLVQHLPGTAHVPTARSAGDWALAPNCTGGIDPLHLWLGPAEQLVVSATRSRVELLATLSDRADPKTELMADLTSALSVLRLSGVGVIAALATDCSLDLEGPALAMGRCAQTICVQCSVLLHRSGAEHWDLYIERSAARFVHDWLVHSGGGATC